MKLFSSIQIKNVNENDLEEIAILEEKIFGIDGFSLELLQKLIHNNIVFVKIVDKTEKILGISICIEGVKKLANLVNFIVRKEYQNQGLGTILLKKTLKEIRMKKRFKTITLNVNVDNEIAIKLYNKFGFNIIKKIENYYESGASSFLMQLKF